MISTFTKEPQFQEFFIFIDYFIKHAFKRLFEKSEVHLQVCNRNVLKLLRIAATNMYGLSRNDHKATLEGKELVNVYTHIHF
ncbi:MAG: hypothetical protein AUK38_02960 [Nitrospirae bacterium CG2_30_41_42]|nr:MAG: hypothetical protein AUK38_02960 [Nitrospirae bacterium CG2_30_41_42]